MLGVVVGRRHGVFVGCLVREVVIESAETLVDGFGDHCICMRANHDVGVGRIGPLRHPSALLVVLEECLHHIRDALRGEEREQAVLGPEGVPN